MTEEKLKPQRESGSELDVSIFKDAKFEAQLEVFGIRYEKKDERKKTAIYEKAMMSEFSTYKTTDNSTIIDSTKDNSVAPHRDEDFDNVEYKHDSIKKVAKKVDLAKDKLEQALIAALENKGSLETLENKTTILLEMAEDFHHDADKMEIFMKRRNFILSVTGWMMFSGGMGLVVLPVVGHMCGLSMFVG